MSEYKARVIERNKTREIVDTWETMSYKSLDLIRVHAYPIAQSLKARSSIEILRDGKKIGYIKKGIDTNGNPMIYYNSSIKHTESELRPDGTIKTIR